MKLRPPRRLELLAGASLPALALLLPAAGALGWLSFGRPLWLTALLTWPLFVWLAQRSLAGLPPRTRLLALTCRGLMLLLVTLALAESALSVPGASELPGHGCPR